MENTTDKLTEKTVSFVIQKIAGFILYIALDTVVNGGCVKCRNPVCFCVHNII